MPRVSIFVLILALGPLAGCTTYNVGSAERSPDNGSYSGSTLNSSVSDQNPDPGGNAGFPSRDMGNEQAPPEKVNGR